MGGTVGIEGFVIFVSLSTLGYKDWVICEPWDSGTCGWGICQAQLSSTFAF